MLGEKWLSAAFFIGLWGLMNGFTITFSHYSSEVYRSKGRPKLSFLSQFFHIIVLIPLVLWATTKGFHFLCEMRAMVKLEAIFVDFILMYLVIKVSPLIMIKNVFPSCIAAFGMYLISLTFPHSENYFIQFLYILPCVLIYFLIILLFKQEREILFNFKSILRRRVGS